MANWYCSSVGWTAVTAWAALTTYVVGDLRRQLAAPTVGNERVFRASSITTGISGASEPSWNLTKATTTTDSGVTWTEVTGNETYNATTFAAPHARLQTAMKSGWPAAGDTIFVAADHAETQAATMTITGVGTNTAPLRVLCINATHSSTPVAADLATTATCTTTGNNVMNITGSMYVYGVTFSCGNGANSVNFNISSGEADITIFDTCVLKCAGTSGGQIFWGGTASANSTASYSLLKNTNVSFASANSAFLLRGSIKWEWVGGTLQGTSPTTLFQPGSSTITTMPKISVRDVDLSLLVAAKFLVNGTNTTVYCPIEFVNCKLATNLGGVLTGTIPAPYNLIVDMVVTDSTANVVVREAHYSYSGSMLSDTVNFRTGGASDGTTPKSWQVVTLGGANRIYPFYCPDIYQWVAAGSKTISLYISNNSSVTAQDLYINFELEYMGSGASPLGTYAGMQLAPAGTATIAALGLLSTGTNWATDTSTWGGPTTNKQVMQQVITIGQAGWIRVRPYVSKAGFTVWIDPLVVVS